ncbi:DNA-3-methyladenine glycosylase I [Acinetobacter populi]|uniref:DNA-3-methyladenine glycosidase n=1 Tax=Acinetobacter populi TaxID=1582270 RepID=A0A1Z9Z3D8_9GAMM|nr:DNA-3-methyladenine glycosylase I [Acinetobacter populi]OUY09003.1 hypothetical protein CAP51_05205 [Acinetobacter populi]
MTAQPQRCFWVSQEPLYQHYHDQEWGQICLDDRALFEQFCLEGQQAGLSWWMVLKKRENYRHYFFQYPIAQIANFSDEQIKEILLDPGIIRHHGKLLAIRENARLWLKYTIEFESLNSHTELSAMTFWLWQHAFYSKAEILDQIAVRRHAKLVDYDLDQLRSWYLSERLKKLGFKFVGQSIIHAYMQAVGMFNHHDKSCFCYQPVEPQRFVIQQRFFHDLMKKT